MNSKSPVWLIYKYTMSTYADPNATYIFIDGSYYCFHRYYSVINWWNAKYNCEPLEDPYQNQIFLEKFKQTFLETITTMPTKLNINTNIIPKIIVGRDCKRENIWRMELYNKYKGTRTKKDGFMGKPFFSMAYEEQLFEKAGAERVLYHPKLEADDCIAITVKHLIKETPNCNIYIITSDRDYLQLNAPNVKIFNLAYKNIAENKTTCEEAIRDLQIKILSGDSSDNIPSVFPKCGPKTAIKCIEDPEFFKTKMNENEDYYKQYEKNKMLIDFDNIPNSLVNEFKAANNL